MSIKEIAELNRVLKSMLYFRLLLDNNRLEVFNAIDKNEFIEHNIYIYLNGELVGTEVNVTKLSLGKYIKGYDAVEIEYSTDRIDEAYSRYKDRNTGINELDGYFKSFGFKVEERECNQKIGDSKQLEIEELENLFGTKVSKPIQRQVTISLEDELAGIINDAKEFIGKAKKLKLKTDKNFNDSVIIQKAVNMQNVLNKLTVGCEKCNHSGHVVDDETGITVQCDCVVSNVEVLKRQLAETKAPNYIIQNDTKMNQLLDRIIPKDRQDDEFSKQIGNDKIIEILKATDSRVVRATDFLDQLSVVLSEIALGVIKHSYILGAPNGFGKTTFVYTGIKRLMAQGKKVVPYKSLTELAQIKVEYERNLLNQFKYGYKDRESKEFTWQDYLEADVLFTYLSTPSSGELESAVLSSLMSIRGNNGKPTIVMVASSLKIYTINAELYKYYWCDMLATQNENIESIGVDRLIHYSCYMTQKRPDYGVKKGRDY